MSPGRDDAAPKDDESLISLDQLRKKGDRSGF
jgi:hypothetical protein